MSVIACSQQHNVKSRETPAQRNRTGNQIRITFRLLRRTTAITMNGVYIFIGHAYLLQQQTQHSTVITVRVADGYTTFVHPENPHPHPRSLFSELMRPNVEHKGRSRSSAESKVKNPLRLPVHHVDYIPDKSTCSRGCSRIYITFHNSQYSSVFVKFLHGLVHSAPCSRIIASLSKGPHVPTG